MEEAIIGILNQYFENHITFNEAVIGVTEVMKKVREDGKSI